MQVLEATDAITLLRDGVSALLAADWSQLDGVAAASLVEEVEVQRRRLDAAAVHLDTAVEDARIGGQLPDCALTDLLHTRLNIDVREARQRARRQEDLGPRCTLLGEPLPPLLPLTAAALERGEISGAHCDVITRYIDRVDRLAGTTPETLEVVEELLVTASRDDAPRLVARLAETLLLRLDPDGTEPRDRARDNERRFLLAVDADGSSAPQGRFTPELTAMLSAFLDGMSAPSPAEDGTPDPRTPAQRRHDALLEGITRLLRGNIAPAGGSTITTLVKLPVGSLLPGGTDPDDLEWSASVPDELRRVITERLRAALGDQPEGHPVAACRGGHDVGGDDLHGWPGIAYTATGGLMSLAWLRRNACEMDVATVLTDDNGGVLAFGRTKRLATKAQRIALAARDGGCSFPGCTRPPAWCEAHHVIPWLIGGDTDLDNLCLVCPYHHRHFGRLGWRVHMSGGVPIWIPPPWIDPEQRPRRNTIRHLEDLPFETLPAASRA